VMGLVTDASEYGVSGVAGRCVARSANPNDAVQTVSPARATPTVSEAAPDVAKRAPMRSCSSSNGAARATTPQPSAGTARRTR
jgi:hypothetical protein